MIETLWTSAPAIELTLSLGKRLAVPVHTWERVDFVDGNTWVRCLDVHRGDRVGIAVSLWGREVHRQLWELLFAVDALKRAGAEVTDVIIPYFSYAKADKTDGVGTSLRVAVVTRALASLPATRIIWGELHSPVTADLVPGSVEVEMTTLVREHFRNLVDETWVVAAPDVGYRTRAEKIASALNLTTAWVEKSRPSLTGAPEVGRLHGEVAGRKVLLVDDFTTTGQTLGRVSDFLRAQGAVSVRAWVSHAPLNEEAVTFLQASSLEEIVTTNSTGLTSAGKIKVIDAASLFAPVLTAA